MVWTKHELDILQTTSRVSSAFSLAGASFIIITFCTSKNFHRPINRLAFFASFGNILTCVATILSMDGIRAGKDSRLCQSQGFIIQWAIPADALFCLAMALNVYLTVFRKKTTAQLRVLEPYYICGCYGLPLITAIVFLFVRTQKKGRIYGPATLWCWIDKEWQVLRIAAFYAPTWIVLAVTFFIYLLAGRIIFRLRQNLRSFARSSPSVQPPIVPGKISVTTVDSVELSTVEDLEAQARERQNGHFACPIRHPNSQIINGITSYRCTIEATCQKVQRKRNNPAMEANRAAWAYCRCAMLFFLALVITWLPSSINRMYNLRFPDETHFGLNFAAALVLPAQGFWNGLIYIVTTFPACKKWFQDIWRLLKVPAKWCIQLKRRCHCLPIGSRPQLPKTESVEQIRARGSHDV